MPPKRPLESGSEATTSTQFKRARLQQARDIAVQPVAGPSSSNAPATGHSVTFNSMKGLPSKLDVEKFVESREFEIKAMQQAQKNASSSATHRAWQELPRHLRRRAASHDVRRVPQRLRGKSAREIDAMKRKALGRSRPKRGKSSQIPRNIQLLKRQVNKRWLETHMWHAKRMKMENMWGFRLAVQPTEKSFRPSHRAAMHGAILHDASYYGLLELHGSAPVVSRLLELCCDPQGAAPSAPRFTGGVRTCDTALYKLKRHDGGTIASEYPLGLIGPVEVMWRAEEDGFEEPAPASANANTAANVPTSKQGKRKRKNKNKSDKGKGKEQQPTETTVRTAWLRVHPTILADALKTLKLAASVALDELRQSSQHVGKEYTIEVANLRDAVNVFEIMGPKSSQVLRGALTPVEGQGKEFNEFCRQLGDLQSPASVPSNMLIGFTVHDPRLNFPPHNAHATIPSEAAPSLPQAFTSTPSVTLASSTLWDPSVRVPLYTSKQTKKAIDARRAQAAIPGTKLKPTPADSRVPVMLIQRSAGPASTSASTDGSGIHGWTLILPKGWAQPFLDSLVYTGTRIAGQRERSAQFFESSSAAFPSDYPLCGAYDEFAKERAEREKERWGRRPPAKRASWGKLGTRSPWVADWGIVLGAEEPGKDGEGEDEELIPAQRMTVEKGKDGKDATPWLLRGPHVARLVSDAGGKLNPASKVFEHVNAARMKRDAPPLPRGVEDALFNGALVRVRMRMAGRGNAEAMAVIYEIGEKSMGKWAREIRSGRIRLDEVPLGGEKKKGKGPGKGKQRTGDFTDDEETEEEEEADEEVVDEDDGIEPDYKDDRVVGYVTTGGYSLSRGCARAIGAIPLSVLLEAQDRARQYGLPGPLVRVRNRDGRVARLAYVDVLEG
ncbi:POP1-domain-containing protein [Peniophora sp. CONT]|nr:POP1-domain-containing protein [Peniophora sp. CONT]